LLQVAVWLLVGTASVCHRDTPLLWHVHWHIHQEVHGSHLDPHLSQIVASCPLLTAMLTCCAAALGQTAEGRGLSGQPAGAAARRSSSTAAPRDSWCNTWRTHTSNAEHCQSGGRLSEASCFWPTWAAGSGVPDRHGAAVHDTALQ